MEAMHLKTARETKPRRTPKKDYDKAVRLNICLPPKLDERKGELLRKFSLTDFSSYIQARMRKDLGIELEA